MREREIFRNYFGPENAGASRVFAATAPHDSSVMVLAHAGARSRAKCRARELEGAGAANATLVLTMTRTTLGLWTMVLALSGFAYACGSAGLDVFAGDGSASREPGDSDAGAGGGLASPAPEGNDLTPVDNAVILVHAAKSQSFRLCFENEIDRLPQPDSQTMPEANVVGVEVGSAVRLGPLRGKPGQVYLFDEPLIRAFYPAFGGAGKGPSCKNLLENANTQALRVELGVVDADLAHGVHLLVVRGCPADGPLRKFSESECGEGWTPTKMNLSVKEIALTGANRPESATLPAQVVNLSRSLDSARAGRDLVVTFGDLASADGAHALVATNPELFGNAAPVEPARLAYAANDIGVYESAGVRVRFVAKAADGGAGPAEHVLDESLARIQKSSSPRDVPPTYYAAASNYALLLLGDPGAKLADGGADDDPRRNLHFLAVPVIDPDDGGAGAPADGGNAPPGP